jgi:hypothetical protein
VGVGVGDVTAVFDDDGEVDGDAVSAVVQAVAENVTSAAVVNARSAFVLVVIGSINSVEPRPMVAGGGSEWSGQVGAG